MLGTEMSQCLAFNRFKVSSESAGESRETCCGSQSSLDLLFSAFSPSHPLCLWLQAGLGGGPMGARRVLRHMGEQSTWGIRWKG